MYGKRPLLVELASGTSYAQAHTIEKQIRPLVFQAPLMKGLHHLVQASRHARNRLRADFPDPDASDHTSHRVESPRRKASRIGDATSSARR
jgi:hypothetical protein